ncbi:MAG: NUDIX domain-containing protein [archaeon]|jgi:ADP-ribose pyrophosphatase YjhB (NUDIX family)
MVEENKTEDITEINKIFKTLIHFPGSTFSDLWDKSIESNKFTYYLKKMEEEGLIEKKEGKYYLTLKGKAEVVTLSGETGKKTKRPFVALLLIAKKKNKYVFFNCLKEPYYGKGGFPGAKVEFGEEILAAASRELKEETNLEGKGKILTVQNVLTVNNGEIFAHMTQFVVLFENPKGDLVKDNREGTYEWLTKKEILSKKNLFPDTPIVIKDTEKKKFSIKEMTFIQKNGNFVGIKERKI